VKLHSPEVCAVLDKLSERHYDTLSIRLQTAKKSPSQQFALQTNSEASCKRLQSWSSVRSERNGWQMPQQSRNTYRAAKVSERRVVERYCLLANWRGSSCKMILWAQPKLPRVYQAGGRQPRKGQRHCSQIFIPNCHFSHTLLSSRNTSEESFKFAKPRCSLQVAKVIHQS
jgi:hypothetical protein